MRSLDFRKDERDLQIPVINETNWEWWEKIDNIWRNQFAFWK
jgi:hypothetical protein